MADGALQVKCRRLRELYRGRFTQEEAKIILQHRQDLNDAVFFVMNCEPETLNELLNRNGPDYINVTRMESEKIKDLLEKSLESDSQPRQFACRTCERCWWKKVPIRKAISRCHRCNVKYDPIPREEEWGRGRFICGHCGHEFITTAIMGMTISLCNRCNYPVRPHEILPPERRPRVKEDRVGGWWGGRGGGWEGGWWGERSVDDEPQHNCNGVNCFECNNLPQDPNRPRMPPLDQPAPDQEKMERDARSGINRKRDKPAVCIHPRSKPDMPPAVRVRTWSHPHVSTGSTVTTCLDQGDLETCTDTLSLAYTMLTINS